jgi:hypothetical protein
MKAQELDVITRFMGNMIHNEIIRLATWGADGTFWKSTLTEGGVTHVRERYALTKTLSRCGIMNAIYYKNDFKKFKELLETRGICKYFISCRSIRKRRVRR